MVVKLAMRITRLFAGVCIILCIAIMLIAVSSYSKWNKDVTTAGQLGFPYELRNEIHTNRVGGELWSAKVLVSRKHYSRENLDRLFLFLSAAHPNQQERMT